MKTCRICGKELDLESWKIKFSKKIMARVGEETIPMKSDESKITICSDCKEHLDKYINDVILTKQMEFALKNGLIKNDKIQHSKCAYFDTDCIHRGVDDDCPDFKEKQK